MLWIFHVFISKKAVFFKLASLSVFLFSIPSAFSMIQNHGEVDIYRNVTNSSNLSNLSKKDLLIIVYEEGNKYGRIKGFLDALKSVKNVDLNSLEEVGNYAKMIRFSYGISLQEPDYNKWLQRLMIDDSKKSTLMENLLFIPGYVAAIGGGASIYKRKLLKDTDLNSGMLLGVLGYGLGLGVEVLEKKIAEKFYGVNSYPRDLVYTAIPLISSIFLLDKLSDPRICAALGGYVVGRILDNILASIRWIIGKKRNTFINASSLRESRKKFLIEELQYSFETGKNANYQSTFNQTKYALSVQTSNIGRLTNE